MTRHRFSRDHEIAIHAIINSIHQYRVIGFGSIVYSGPIIVNKCIGITCARSTLFHIKIEKCNKKKLMFDKKLFKLFVSLNSKSDIKFFCFK